MPGLLFLVCRISLSLIYCAVCCCIAIKAAIISVRCCFGTAIFTTILPFPAFPAITMLLLVWAFVGGIGMGTIDVTMLNSRRELNVTTKSALFASGRSDRAAFISVPICFGLSVLTWSISSRIVESTSPLTAQAKSPSTIPHR